jgi:hypothetical protein
MEKQMSYNSNDEKPKRSRNYAKIIKWVIIVILVIGFGGVIKELFVGLSGIEKAIADAFGAAANLANTATDSCAKRVECTLYPSSGECNSDKQCIWGAAYNKNCANDDDCDTGDTCDDTGECNKTEPQSCYNKEKSGPDGFLSFNCAYTFYGILGICTTIVLALIGGLVKFLLTRRRQNIENEARLRDISEGSVLAELTAEIKKLKDTIDRKNDVTEDGKEPRDRLFDKLLVEKVSEQRAIRELDKDSNPEAENQSQAARDEYKQKADIAKKEAKDKYDLTDADVNAIEDSVENELREVKTKIE